MIDAEIVSETLEFYFLTMKSTAQDFIAFSCRKIHTLNSTPAYSSFCPSFLLTVAGNAFDHTHENVKQW